MVIQFLSQSFTLLYIMLLNVDLLIWSNFFLIQVQIKKSGIVRVGLRKTAVKILIFSHCLGIQTNNCILRLSLEEYSYQIAEQTIYKDF
jgi:hypothetical protein